MTRDTAWGLSLTDGLEGTPGLLEVTGRIEQGKGGGRVYGVATKGLGAQSHCILDIDVNVILYIIYLKY